MHLISKVISLPTCWNRYWLCWIPAPTPVSSTWGVVTAGWRKYCWTQDNVYGIDASESGIRIARRRYPDRFFVQNIDEQLLPEAIRHLPFDTIISTEVIEHLYDPRGYVAFCKKVLTHGAGRGSLILSTPYHGYLKNVALSLSGKMDAHFTALWDGGHIKFWSRKTLTQLLGEQQFRVKTFKGCGRLPWLWKSMLIRADLEA